eukprot:TRINITY_DN21865_c0_g3_i1.p1 TRINITY_DN21865_c0_g3~~TRINITY_DN21865_c0_g3_i1.p1  ORF type:complete len:550 (-),score=33.72 TRINITY_DN21865_c0_g3_i1:53-1702(-)
MSLLETSSAHDFRVAVLVLCVWSLLLCSLPWCRFCEKARRLRSVLAAWICMHQDPDLIEEEVLVVYKQRKLAWRRKGVQYFTSIALAMCLIQTVRLLQSIINGVTDRVLSPVQDYLVIILTVYAVVFPYLFNFMDKKDRIATFVWWCDVFHQLSIHSLQAAAKPEYFQLTVLTLAPMRFFMAFLTMDVRLTAFNGAVYTAIYAWVRFSLPEPGHIGLDVRNQAVLVIVLVCIDATIQKLVEAEAVSLAKASKMCAASAGLLDLFCDCVIELSHDLHILSDARKFAAMLFFGKDNTMIGSSFRSYLEESCREKLHQALHGASGDGGPPTGALSARVRDSLGTWLSVELFYIRFRGIDMETRFLVGLRESCQDHSVMGVYQEPLHRAQRAETSMAEPGADTSADTNHARTARPDRESAHPRVSPSEGLVLEPMLPTKPLTSEQGKLGLAKSVLSSVNFILDDSACCDWHEAIRNFVGILEGLLHKHPCVADFSCDTSWQCGHCGVLGSTRPNDERCHCCWGVDQQDSAGSAYWQSKKNATAFGAETPTTDL